MYNLILYAVCIARCLTSDMIKDKFLYYHDNTKLYLFYMQPSLKRNHTHTH